MKQNDQGLGQELVRWYERYHRDLPWRRDRDPYKIWVSEVMLQQTRVDTVIPYFKHFMTKFPTVEALAQADEQEVLKAWEGLGYYSRARNLQQGVREVYEHYDAKVPEDIGKVRGLKGVGPYTAGAILSIAYGQAQPAVDGNVSRVISRIFLLQEDITKAKTRKIIEQKVEGQIPAQHAGSFNQALMELGALVCTPKSPQCLVCPVKEYCGAYEQGMQEALPVKARKKPPKTVPVAVAVLKNQGGQVLIHRRPQQGLLAGLWEFPGFEVGRGGERKQLIAALNDTYQIKARLQYRLPDIEHVFTHLKWQLSVYEGVVTEEVCEREDLKFVDATELSAYPFPVSHQKIIRSYQEGERHATGKRKRA